MSLTPSASPEFQVRKGLRLKRKLERSDPFLMRALHGAALIGIILGVLIYTWQAARNDTASSRHALAEAAATGQIAAEAEIARINAAAVEVSPLIAMATRADVTPRQRRSLQVDITAKLAGTPVTAIVIFNDAGETLSVFGQMPSDAAGAVGPRSASRRAGAELLGLELVQVAKNRAAVYRDIQLGNGAQVGAALVLRASAFQTSLQLGAAAGNGWRAALLNRDGDTILTGAAKDNVFSPADARLAASALGWRPLHEDESNAHDRVTGQEAAAFIETRSVSGDMLQLAYVGQARPVFSVLASRRFEFIALFGASVLALLLAISVIQNEWQRQDFQVRNADLAVARAEITCDLLAAGVIDWSVSDGTVDYSEGWSDMFAQGDEPLAEEIFDWVARVHHDDRLAARQAYQDMLDGKTSELVHRIRIRMSSGLWVQVVERGRALAGRDGQVKRIVLVQTTEAVDGSALRTLFGDTKPPDQKAG